MKPPVLLFAMLALTTAGGAYAEKKQANISGTRAETHISGASTPQGNKDGKIRVSGATTPANAERNAPGETHKPSQPKQPTVEKPHSPRPPHIPAAPNDK